MLNKKEHEEVIESIDITTSILNIRKGIAKYFIDSNLIKEENMSKEVVEYVIKDISNYSACLAYNVQCILTNIETYTYIEDLANNVGDFYNDDIPDDLTIILELTENVNDTFYNLIYSLTDLFTDLYLSIANRIKKYSTSNDAKIKTENDIISLVIVNSEQDITVYTDLSLGQNLGNIPVFRYDLSTAYIIFKELTGKDDTIAFKKIIEYSSYIWNNRPHGDMYDISPEEIKDYLDLDVQVYLIEILKIVNGLPKYTIKNFYGWISETLSIRSIKNVEYS